MESHAERLAEQVRAAMAESGEAASYIRRLEEQHGANLPRRLLLEQGGGELPPAEDMLTDIERFLREQGEDDG